MSATSKRNGAIWLRTEGNAVIVAVERDGEWIDVIREHADIRESTISHIVEPSGIDARVEAHERAKLVAAGQQSMTRILAELDGDVRPGSDGRDR